MHTGVEIAQKLAPLLHKFKLTDKILCTVKDQGANLGARFARVHALARLAVIAHRSNMVAISYRMSALL